MASNKIYKLGDLICLQDERNSDLRYSVEDVKGISIQKVFIETKADMMKDAFENDVKKAELIPLVNLSCSCAKRGHNIHWDKSGAEIRENNITHCGMCLPCLYRRVALDAVGLDNTENLGTDVLNGQKYNINDLSQKRAKDFRALLYFLRYR